MWLFFLCFIARFASTGTISSKRCRATPSRWWLQENPATAAPRLDPQLQVGTTTWRMRKGTGSWTWTFENIWFTCVYIYIHIHIYITVYLQIKGYIALYMMYIYIYLHIHMYICTTYSYESQWVQRDSPWRPGGGLAISSCRDSDGRGQESSGKWKPWSPQICWLWLHGTWGFPWPWGTPIVGCVWILSRSGWIVGTPISGNPHHFSVFFFGIKKRKFLKCCRLRIVGTFPSMGEFPKIKEKYTAFHPRSSPQTPISQIWCGKKHQTTNFLKNCIQPQSNIQRPSARHWWRPESRPARAPVSREHLADLRRSEAWPKPGGSPRAERWNGGTHLPLDGSETGETLTQMLHVWHIYQHWPKNHPNVGKDSIHGAYG